MKKEVEENREVFPSPSPDVFLRAFKEIPEPFDVKVIIIGQDPYPRPVHPIGLSFGVPNDVDLLPSSLQNICDELLSDTGEFLDDTTLVPWAKQGVLMLNTRLTVGSRPMSHAWMQWENLTGCAVSELTDQKTTPVIVVAWGKEAREFAEKYVNNKDYHPIITSAHPCKFSAKRGFFGSKPFSTINSLLIESGQDPIRWGKRVTTT